MSQCYFYQFSLFKKLTSIFKNYMKLGPELLKLLAKVYEPSVMIETNFHRYDLAIKTDEAGRPVLLFIGKKDANGQIRGTRFIRRLLTNKEGVVVKDHWDNKGNV
jgi:hypothetical protein